MEKITICSYSSPVGELKLGSYNNQLCLCDWAESKRHEANKRRISDNLKAEFEEASSEIINIAINELVEYFSGARSEFSIPLLSPGTKFQCQVWTELMKIAYGTTITYRELACRIGMPNAVRAVASAVASNPISIFVPCHRVIGSDRSLTGYAGGIAAKKALLFHENLPTK